MGNPRLEDPPRPHPGGVGHPDGAPGGDHVVADQEGGDHPEQGVGLDQRVGVDGAGELTRRDVHAGVEGVGLAAILFVDHDQAWAGG